MLCQGVKFGICGPRPQTRVIAFSMHDEPETIERMRRAGAERYVLKTAPSEELLVAVRGEETDA